MLKCQRSASRSPHPQMLNQMGTLVTHCGGNDKE